MRCVCARIRTSFSCTSICNLWARLEKAPVLRRLFCWAGRNPTPQAYVAAKLDGFAETRNSGAPKLAQAADPPKGGSVSLGACRI